MDEASVIETSDIVSSEDPLVEGVTSTVDDDGSIMLKVESGNVDIISGGHVAEEIQSMGFTDEDIVTQVQTVNTVPELASLDQTQLILQTIPSQADGAAADSTSVSGTFVADAGTLQKLIASGAVQITDASGQPIQFLTLENGDQPTTETTAGSQISPGLLIGPVDLQGDNGAVMTSLGTDGDVKLKSKNCLCNDGSKQNQAEAAQSDADQRLMQQVHNSTDVTPETLARISLYTGPPPPQDLPLDTPTWAARLRDCQKIGDFYRGWLSSEVELDLVLTLHKQQTQTMWGTRQSPCPSKPATRLMWKSQYVPFDGMPFLNAGSRAIVMECQYGPRRKGSNTRKDELAPLKSDFKQTCPARIYIKKVKKFLEYQVEVDSDKKNMKLAMDRAFHAIKEKNYEGIIQERFYIQLPTEKAHEFHQIAPEQQSHPHLSPEKLVEMATVGVSSLPSRIHPIVAEKIREFVSMGETRLYTIRKQLRKFVEKEMFDGDAVPDKHNLQYYPTVNDLQNHIHQAIRDIEAGILPVSASAVNLELVNGCDIQTVWQNSESSPHAETVTVTLTQQPGEEGHVISKVETNLSDGSTSTSDNLGPETAKLLAKLHPQVFTSINPEEGVINLSNSSSADPSSGQGIDPPIVSRSTGPQSSDTTITVNIPRSSINTQPEYTVLQTESGALLLTKANTLSNQSAAGVFTVDTGNGSMIPVMSTDGTILQAADGAILNLVTQSDEGNPQHSHHHHHHDETVQSTDLLDNIHNQSESLTHGIVTVSSQSDCLVHNIDENRDSDRLIQSVEIIDNQSQGLEQIIKVSHNLTDLPDGDSDLNRDHKIPNETKTAIVNCDNIQLCVKNDENATSSPKSKRRKVDLSSTIKTENIESSKDSSMLKIEFNLDEDQNISVTDTH